MATIVEIITEVIKNPAIAQLVVSSILVAIGAVLEGKYFPIRKVLRRILGVTNDAERLLKEFKDVIIALDKATEDNKVTIEEVESIKVETEEFVEAIEEIIAKHR